jgi:hypothetical protein
VFKCFLFDPGKIELAPFSPRPLLLLLFALKSITFSLLSPPSTLSHCRQTNWPVHPGATEPARPCGPASTLDIPCWPTNSHSPPYEPSTRRHLSAVGAAGATASLAGDSEAAVPPVLDPPGRTFSSSSCPGRHPPSRAYESPTRGPLSLPPPT